MAEEFGTVSSKKSDRAREIARLREHYRNHRETLSGLMGDAPSDHLAKEYERLIADIDTSVRKIDELEGATPGAAASTPAVDTNPMLKPKTRPGSTAPGTRPLVRPSEPVVAAGGRNPGLVVGMMIIAAVVVLGAIGYLVWRPRSTRNAEKPVIVEQPVTTSSAQNSSTAPPTISPASPPSSLKITPALADYGTIRKGTRAVRQFEVVNTSGAPIDIQVARSACRCLFYDYKSKLAAKGKETITVTVDGARAKAGALQEQLQISAKNDPNVSGTITVQATVR